MDMFLINEDEYYYSNNCEMSTYATELCKECSTLINKIVREKIHKFYFGVNNLSFDFEGSRNTISSFVHNVLSIAINQNIVDLEKLMKISKDIFYSGSFDFDFNKSYERINGMYNNFLILNNDGLFNGKDNSYTERLFYSRIEKCLIELMPDYVDNDFLIDYKNYTYSSYDFRRLVYYSLCLPNRKYCYVNLLRGELIIIGNSLFKAQKALCEELQTIFRVKDISEMKKTLLVEDKQLFNQK